MRRAQVLTIAGATALLVSACSNRPNDLYTYYDDPTPSTSAAAARATSAAPTASRPTTTAPSQDWAKRLDKVSLAAADLAAEEVTPDGAPSTVALTALPDCSAPLEKPAAARGSAWRYASGSVLRQYTAAYPKGAAAPLDTLRKALDCGTFTAQGVTHRVEGGATLTGLSEVDDQETWCAVAQKQSTCSAVLVRGDLLTVLTVEASTPARAKAAITRLAPLAAKALNRR